MFRPIAPIAAQSSARALPFTHQEKTALFASAGLLRGEIQSQIPFEPRFARLHIVDAVFVSPRTIALLTVSFDARNGCGGIRIAAGPNTCHLLVPAKKHVLHVSQ